MVSQFVIDLGIERGDSWFQWPDPNLSKEYRENLSTAITSSGLMNPGLQFTKDRNASSEPVARME